MLWRAAVCVRVKRLDGWGRGRVRVRIFIIFIEMNYTVIVSKLRFFNDFSFWPWRNTRRTNKQTNSVAYTEHFLSLGYRESESTRLQWNCNSKISWHDTNKPLCHKISTSFHFIFGAPIFRSLTSASYSYSYSTFSPRLVFAKLFLQIPEMLFDFLHPLIHRTAPHRALISTLLPLSFLISLFIIQEH